MPGGPSPLRQATSPTRFARTSARTPRTRAVSGVVYSVTHVSGHMQTANVWHLIARRNDLVAHASRRCRRNVIAIAADRRAGLRSGATLCWQFEMQKHRVVRLRARTMFGCVAHHHIRVLETCRSLSANTGRRSHARLSYLRLLVRLSHWGGLMRQFSEPCSLSCGDEVGAEQQALCKNERSET